MSKKAIKVFAGAVLLLAVVGVSVSLAAKKKLDLSEGWVFKVGDDKSWSEPALDDSGWKPIEVGVEWEKEGFPDLDGYAWYRLKVTIPEEWKDSRQLEDYGWLALGLGAIDDADETFFNGKKIGATGVLPPDYSGAWDQPRTYRVAPEDVKWGAENVIAVRVYDGDGKGGMYPGPVSLRLPTAAEAVKMSFEPGRENGVFPAGEALQVTLKLENEARIDMRGVAECVWRTDRPMDKTVLGKEKVKITIPAGEETSRSFSYLPPGPGFYPVRVRLALKGGKAKEEYLVPGYDPEEIRGPKTKEGDFARFWKARLRDLAGVKPEYKVGEKPDKSTEDVTTYLVEMKSYRGIRVRGWFTVPKKGPGPHPGLLMVAGYGGNMQPATGFKDVAVLALNIRGQGNSRQDLTADAEYMYTGLTQDPADYVYVGAYLDCVRGIDFLSSRPEVDPGRIGMTGGSQGGGMTLATCALDPRIRAAAADVPWLCDWPDYAETAWWSLENFPKLARKRKDLGREKIISILSYIDVMNLADRIRCPVLVSMGLRDNTCPPRTIMAMYNRIKADKRIYYYPYGGHNGGGWKHWAIKDEWMKKKVGVSD